MYPDAMQLVANVSGNHHLLCFTANKPPSLYIFDAQLQLRDQKEIAVRVKEDCDIRILPLADCYFLYIHSPGSTAHQLWKIDGEGDAVDLSASFQRLVDSSLKQSISTLQLVNQDDHLFIIAHTYFEAVKKMRSTIIAMDKNAVPLQSRTTFYAFDKTAETLQQAALAGNNLLVLTSGRDDEKGNSLTITKTDLATGRSTSNSFNSGSHFYTDPAFIADVKDATLLIYATIRESAGSARAQRVVFISRLDSALHEKTPIGLLKTQFRANTAVNFLLPQGTSAGWLEMNNSGSVRRLNAKADPLNDFVLDNPATFNLRKFGTSSTYFAGYNQLTGVRFTLLNEKFHVLKDSLVANKTAFDIEPRPSARFVLNNKAYLILVQHYTSKHKGLLMINEGVNSALEASDLRVYDQYDYELPLLQAVGNSYIIIPYTYKNEIGLVKIKME